MSRILIDDFKKVAAERTQGEWYFSRGQSNNFGLKPEESQPHFKNKASVWCNAAVAEERNPVVGKVENTICRVHLHSHDAVFIAHCANHIDELIRLAEIGLKHETLSKISALFDSRSLAASAAREFGGEVQSASEGTYFVKIGDRYLSEAEAGPFKRRAAAELSA